MATRNVFNQSGLSPDPQPETNSGRRSRVFFFYFLFFTCILISSVVIVCLQEEIQQLKAKLERVEKERNELRLNTDRLESKVRKKKSQRNGKIAAPTN